MSKQDYLSAAQGDQIPADMIHFRQIVSEAVDLFSESMGLLLLLALLKLSPARDHAQASRQVFDVLLEAASAIAKDEDMSTEMPQATASTGGPLHAHGFLRQMSYFGIVKKATSRDKRKGKCLQLGFPSKGSKAWYAPQCFSKEIDEEIRAVLSLHECLLSLMLLFYTNNLYTHYNIRICIHTMINIYIYIYIHVFYITTYPALY